MNSIYDILNKLNSIQPAVDVPATEPVKQKSKLQESIDSLSEKWAGDAEVKSLEEESKRLSIGQQMARDGITYSVEREKELIGIIGDYLAKNGHSEKAIRYYLSYDEDFVPDTLSELPKEGVAEEETVEEWANSPEGVEGDEEYQGVDAAIPSGDDLHKAKGAYPATAGGDNPMAIDEEMWAAYQALKAELQ